jgi:O-antigen/teichoic acid export membrane protein
MESGTESGTEPTTQAPGRARRAIGLLVGRLAGVAGALAAGQVIIGLMYVVGARAITPATLGLIATCVAIGTIAATVFDAGLIALLTREVAAGAVDLDRARGVVRAKRRLSWVLVLPTTAACVVIAPTPASGVVLGFLGLAMWEAQSRNGLLRAQERFTVAATAQVTGRALGLVTVLLLVLAGAPVIALPIALVLAFALEAALGRYFLGSARVPTPSQREVWGLYREAFSYGLASLAASAQQLDTPLVALGAGPVGAGLYAAAGRLLGPLGFFATALGLVGAPWLARARDDEPALRGEERRIVGLALLLAAVPLLAAVLGPPLLPLVLGEQYATSGPVLAVLAVGSVFSTLNQPLAIMLQNRGHQRTTAVAITIGLGLGLVSTWVLAILGGAVWAAAGFVLSQVVILVHLAIAARRVRGRAVASRAA